MKVSGIEMELRRTPQIYHTHKLPEQKSKPKMLIIEEPLKVYDICIYIVN